MSIRNWNAGIIRPVAVAPTGPFQDGAAKGVWTLDQQAFWQKQGLWPIAGNVNVRGVFAGGSINDTVIQYLQIGTLGNTTNFGSLTIGGSYGSGCASSTRAVWGGRGNGYPQSYTMDYITISTTGNAIYFGDINASDGKFENAAFNSTTRGVFSGGRPTTTNATASTYYITIASLGNAVNFGTLSLATTRPSGCSSSTRGLVCGGYNNAFKNVIDYFTIATTGNATNFGDILVPADLTSAASSSTRGIIFGGRPSGAQNVIQYVTIATTGNAVDFGDLSIASQGGAATSNSTRAINALGANNSGTEQNVIEYVTIATTGNSADFGDLLTVNAYLYATSNGNGGLQ